MIRVLVVDDFPLFRHAVVAALERSVEIEVVGTAGDGEEAIAVAHELRPDVIVLDVRMPGMSGMTALSHLNAEVPTARVLLLTASTGRDLVVDAVASGAAGFLPKSTRGDELAAAVAAVHRGEAVIPPSLMSHVVTGLQERETPAAAQHLSCAQRDLVRLVAQGRTDREIGEELYISPRTVQNQLTRVREKVGVRTRVELTRWAIEHRVT
jgi:DNA-binding NarL/FixJ family response regulator